MRHLLFNDIFAPYVRKFVLVYLDDILVYSSTFADHQHHLELVAQLLAQHQLIVKPNKTQLFRRSIKYLGMEIDGSGELTSLSPSKNIQGRLNAWPVPHNIKELNQFLGFVNFYRQFVPNCAALMKPLVTLLSKNVPFIWGQQHQQAFNSLTELLVQLPKLYTSNLEQTFNIFSEASDFALGAVLEQNGHPILYASRVLNACERRYSTYDKELLAIYFAFKQFRAYIWGAKKVVLHTDHHSLSHLFKQKDLSSRQARYLDFFADFDFEIKYIRGSQNHADALSRIRQGPALCYITVVSPVVWADIKSKI